MGRKMEIDQEQAPYQHQAIEEASSSSESTSSIAANVNSSHPSSSLGFSKSFLECVEWIGSSKAVRQHEVNYMLKQLESLNSPRGPLLITTLEKYNEVLAVIFEDLGRMEGLLANEDLSPRDPLLRASLGAVRKSLEKLSDKHNLIAEVATEWQTILGKAEALAAVLDKEGRTELAKDDDDPFVNGIHFSLSFQYSKVYAEIYRRFNRCCVEYQRKIIELIRID